jgi:hypothetical protein
VSTRPGQLQLQSHGAYWNEYRSRPEHKSLEPDATPCHPWTRGLLQPPQITANEPLQRIGKETAPTADANTDPAEPISPGITYQPLACLNCGEPLTGRHRKYCSDCCRKRHSRAPYAAVEPSRLSRTN